jgi:hypothetical protein
MDCPAASLYAFGIISLVVIVGVVCGTWGSKSSAASDLDRLIEQYRNAPDWLVKLGLLYRMTRTGVWGTTAGVAAIGFPAATAICFDFAVSLNALRDFLDWFWPSEKPVPKLAPPTAPV